MSQNVEDALLLLDRLSFFVKWEEVSLIPKDFEFN
jgi:hypothetical protein